MTGAATTASAALRGRRILVVEDEYMIAEEIASVLSDAGAVALGPVPRVDNALRLIASESRIDGALLDVTLHNQAVWPVVDVLLARHVPLVLATGYDARGIPQAYVRLPRQEKPTTGQELTRALAKVLVGATSA